MDSSLLNAMSETFNRMEKEKTPDGEGGSTVNWVNGIEFDAVIAHDTTVIAQQAEAEKTASAYTLLIPGTMELRFPDVIKRKRDGETFQVTTNSDDLKTPAISSMNLRAVKMRKWVLPK